METTYSSRISFVGAALAALCLMGAGAAASAQQTSSDAVVGPGGPSVNSTTTPSNPPKLVAGTAMQSQIASGWLTDQVVTHLGELQDKLTFTVSNKTKNAIHYEFDSGQQFDIVITDSSGNEVWDWAKSRVAPQLMTRITLRPGASRDFTVTWNRRNENDIMQSPGTYAVQAMLLAMPRMIVSGTSTMDVNREHGDPTNVGTPGMIGGTSSLDTAQGGAVEQSDLTPPVVAKTTIVIAPGTR